MFFKFASILVHSYADPFIDSQAPQYPGRFFEIHCYFSKIAGNSPQTALNLLRTADAPLS